MSGQELKVSRSHIFLFLLLYTTLVTHLEYFLFEYCGTASFITSFLGGLLGSFLVVPMIIALVISLFNLRASKRREASEDALLELSGQATLITLISYGFCCMVLVYHFYHDSLLSSEGFFPPELGAFVHSIFFPFLFALYFQGQMLYSYPIFEVTQFSPFEYIWIFILLYLAIILASFVGSIYFYKKYGAKHNMYFAMVLGGLLSLFCVAQLYAHSYPYNDVGDGACGNAIERVGTPFFCGPTSSIY